MDIVVWLRSLGLGKYEAAFRENDIDETVLPSLTDEHLKQLGVASLGHRVKHRRSAQRGERQDTIRSRRDLVEYPKRRSRRPRRAPPSDGDVLKIMKHLGILTSAGIIDLEALPRPGGGDPSGIDGE